MGRNIPRSCLKLLRWEEAAEDRRAKVDWARSGGAPKQEPQVSRRQRSYQKAQAEARRQEEAVSDGGKRGDD